MSYFPSNNFPIKHTTLKSFYDPDNFIVNSISPFGSYIKRGMMLFNNGECMSVQAGNGLYCSPRQDDVIYHEVEVGYPSFEHDVLIPYAEDKDDLKHTVYGYTPIEIVIFLIFENEGLKGYKK